MNWSATTPNGGAEWEPGGIPTRVGVHDFTDAEVGKAIPYGVLNVGAKQPGGPAASFAHSSRH